MISYDDVGNTIEKILDKYDEDAHEAKALVTLGKADDVWDEPLDATTESVNRGAPKMPLRSREVFAHHRPKNTAHRPAGAFKLKEEQGASQRFLDASDQQMKAAVAA